MSAKDCLVVAVGATGHIDVRGTLKETRMSKTEAQRCANKILDQYPGVNHCIVVQELMCVRRPE
jgi:hypothetical protein